MKQLTQTDKIMRSDKNCPDMRAGKSDSFVVSNNSSKNKLKINLILHYLKNERLINEVLERADRRICHYQQNVPQHYYLLDTLV